MGLDDLEPDEWIEPVGGVAESAALAAAVLDPQNPVGAGVRFFYMLGSGTVEQLADLVTPESRDGWGDFADARAALSGFERCGYSSSAPRGARDVAYPRMINTQASFGHDPDIAIHGEQLAVGFPVTVVWRPEFGQWMVHALGELALDDLPRSSPGAAPAPDLV